MDKNLMKDDEEIQTRWHNYTAMAMTCKKTARLKQHYPFSKRYRKNIETGISKPK